MRYTLDTLDASIFRAYDIRGIVGDSLNNATVYHLGRAFAAQAKSQHVDTLVVGADGRLSGPEYKQCLIEGLVDGGMTVSDLGYVATPITYFAAHQQPTVSCIMITGSHNPSDYNGFKLMLDGDTLAETDIQALYIRMRDQSYGDLSEIQTGHIIATDIRPQYHAYINQDIQLDRPIKVVVDCGNGIAGIDAPKLLSSLGCQVTELYCNVDGHFPNHHPDPSKYKNLTDVIHHVAVTQADLGLAFDGDGDRIGVITSSGKIIDTDRLMMLLSEDALSRNPNAEVLYDVKCSHILPKVIENAGGKATLWKTGHSLMKRKMRESGALIAGEMSGHIYLKERWFGFDDGLYVAARLLAILAASELSADEIFAKYPQDISTPELHIDVTDDSKFSIVAQLASQSYEGGQLQTIDGLRVDYADGWGLVRASNTTPTLVLRFEAESDKRLAAIKTDFEQRLQAIDSELRIPNE